NAELVAGRIAQIRAIPVALVGRPIAGRAFVRPTSFEPCLVRGLHLVLGRSLECDHHAVAGTCRIAVERRADINAVTIRALRAVADPAAVSEFALMPEGAEKRVIKLARRLAVLGADGDIADHENPPEIGRRRYPIHRNKEGT